MTVAITQDPEYRALLDYAARIGRDPTLVQGAGGNVSIKRDGVLWVKASGTWLAEAGRREIMVPVRLGPLLAAVRSGADVERTEPFVADELNPSGLRPSIETTMHGVLPHPVVVHVHCVETIAWATRAFAASAVAPLLAGLPWAFVPYVRPGAPLTRGILEHAPPGTDVLILGNHGLTVGAADVAGAAALLAEVSRRLRLPVRSAISPDLPRLEALAAGTPYRVAVDAAVHGVATDPESLAVARCGSLYPDHVIFLGPGIVEADGEIGEAQAPMLVVPGAGVLLREDASAGAAALARCLADVTARIDPTLALTVLTAAEEAELLGWDAEKYRQGLDKR